VSCCRRCVSADTISIHWHTDVPQVRGLAALERKHVDVETAHDAPTTVPAAGRRALTRRLQARSTLRRRKAPRPRWA
jgi:hypothetical protein